MNEPVRPPQPGDDIRVYVPEPEGWTARVKPSFEKEYCYYKRPGEDFFHLLMCGEVYLERPGEKICLQCALQRGIVTTDRLSWQHQPKKLG